MTNVSHVDLRRKCARTVCAALGGRWYGGGGVCFCPAHQNTRTPALSLSDGSDGKLLVYCHAGCAGGDVLAALRARGLLAGHSEWRPDHRGIERRNAEEETEIQQAEQAGDLAGAERLRCHWRGSKERRI